MGKKSPTRFAGNINLKGKKEHLLSCRCCMMYDFRDYVRERDDNKYIVECINELGDHNNEVSQRPH